MRFIDQFYKVAFTVDSVVFGFDEGELKILLIKRGEEPYSGQWALPGYFVQEGETLDVAATRVLQEFTGLHDVYLEQVHTFGALDRHPNGRVITVGYFALIKVRDHKLHSSTSPVAQQSSWHSIQSLGNLAFDHNEIVEACLTRLRQRVRTQPIGFELLTPKFTLTALQKLYEAILLPTSLESTAKLDKRNFRKKILGMNLLVDLNERQSGVAHRPAKLYRFERERYLALQKEGFSFEL